MDIKSPKERSYNMSRIKNANTRPEKFIKSLLFNKGLRYRVNYLDLPGKPDIYFPRKKVAIFVHGCYWHRHTGCKYAYTPKSNVNFWMKKLEENKQRNEVVNSQLVAMGIRVLVVWECTVKKMNKDEKFCSDIINVITDFVEKDEFVLMNL